MNEWRHLEGYREHFDPATRGVLGATWKGLLSIERPFFFLRKRDEHSVGKGRIIDDEFWRINGGC